MKNAALEKNLFSDKTPHQGHLINIDIYKGENLAPLNSLVCDSFHYVKLKYSGAYVTTDSSNSLYPSWNQNLSLACTLPNQSKIINLEVWDYKFKLMEDDLLGIGRISFRDIKEKERKIRWANIYGPPMSAQKGEMYDLMTLYGDQLGSNYRGRIMYGGTTQFANDPMTECQNIEFNFPYNPEP